MRSDSLFAEIVLQLAPHPENLATEALLYLLRRYPLAWPALRAWIGLTGLPVPEALAFRTQVTDHTDDAIPDLVGVDADGDPIVICEAKFWADLTPNQPATYVRRLPTRKPALVLVLAPALRFEILWPKLRQNCVAAGIVIGEAADVAHELRSAAVGPTHVLALTSWGATLARLLSEADTRHDHHLRSDLEQLSGLCARMDSTEFLPLGPHDVSRHLGQRVQQFADLVDKVVAVLVHTHGANTKGLTTGGNQATYGRYFRLGTLACFLAYAPPLWARYGETPLWLRVKNEEWKTPQSLREQLHRAFAGLPNRVCEDEGYLYVGINLPVGIESGGVIAEIVRQILFTAEKCPSGSGAPEPRLAADGG